MGLRCGIMVLGMVVVSGCSGMRSAQGTDRLQSQVALLDERVAQLERSTARSTASASPEYSAVDQLLATAPASTASESKAAAPGTTSAHGLKPGTREIQQALKNAGFYQGSVDGKMGPGTKDAIREFQRVNGLKVDGVVGKQTWAKLSAYADLSASNGELGAAEILK